MTQDEIIEITRQLGGFDATPDFLKRFANLVAAREREACAKLCESRLERWVKNIGKDKMYKWMQGLPDLIRARGTHD